MSKTVIVRYQTTAEAAEENQLLVEQVYAQLLADDPGGLRYATFRLVDGVSFVHIAIVDGDLNPLPGLAAFQAFQSDLPNRLKQDPEPSEATLIGSYRF